MTKRYDVYLEISLRKLKLQMPMDEAVKSLVEMVEKINLILPDFEVIKIVPTLSEVEVRDDEA